MRDDLIGQQLDEYRLLALLGRGGMARVYLGLDVGLKRYVSIKVIDPPFRSDPGYVQRFEREAQAVARLEHPRIVRLYRYGQAGDMLYMAMQYVEGADLESLLSTYRQNDQFILPTEAQRIVGEVCQALDYAHARGVVHRDVKPGNILVDSQGHAYLTDFGLALFAEPPEGEEHFGTPQYMAPEQILSPAGALPESDLYALGIVLYEMFTGQLPFDGETMQVAASQVHDAPRAPRRIRPDINPALEALILKALAKDPRDRYQSGAELARALDRALQTEPATPVTPAYLTMGERVTAELQRQPAPPAPATGRRRAPAPPVSEAPVRRSLRVPAPAPLPAPRRRRGGRCLVVLILLLLAALLAAAGFLLAWSGDLRLPNWLPTIWGGVGQATDVAAGPTATEPLPLATFTVEPSPAPTEAPTQTPEPTPTEAPTATLEPPSPTPPQARWEVEIVVNDDRFLFLINRRGAPLPLASVRLIGAEGRTIDGVEWGVDSLAEGQCVLAIKASSDSAIEQLPACELLGQGLRYRPNQVVWSSEFAVVFEGQHLTTCDRTGCRFEIF
ncbi:MAG: serine/threonine protein kinase [Anaerolineaceae bacterium]|nr:serine/threonine protein kinase [Anaerolineaceae bacterium]